MNSNINNRVVNDNNNSNFGRIFSETLEVLETDYDQLSPIELSDSDDDNCETADIVNLIDDSDIENYEIKNDAIEHNEEENSDIDEEIIEESVNNNQISQTSVLTSRDGTIWSQEPPKKTQPYVHNILREYGGASKETAMKTSVETFKRIFSYEMCEIIIRETNRKGNQMCSLYNEKNPTKSPRTWSPLNAIELDAYLGILITAGVHRSNFEHTRDLWQTNAYPLYRASMSLKRFWVISRVIRFDNAYNRQERLNIDKAAPISSLWELMNKNLCMNYKAGSCVTIDEQLFPFRGRVKFLQYIPSKPSKYGIKIWWACDSKNSYPLQGKIYTGKDGDAPREPNESVGEKVVKEFAQRYRGTGRCIITDNFFTSLPLAKMLMEWKLSLVGTLNKRKICIPSEMQASPYRTPFSSIFGFREKVSLFSYVPKKRKSVILLSTMHYTKNIIGAKQKPEAIHFYNEHKSGVDNMDKMLGEYSTKRITKRWPQALFYNILDVCALAAYIIYFENNPVSQLATYKRRKFLQELGEQLALPQIEQRSQCPRTIGHFGTRLGIESILGTRINLPRSSQQETQAVGGRKRKKGYCITCKANKRRRQTRKACSACNHPICDEHSTNLHFCNQCKQ